MTDDKNSDQPEEITATPSITFSEDYNKGTFIDINNNEVTVGDVSSLTDITLEEMKQAKPPLAKSPYAGVSYSRGNNKWVVKALGNPDENGKRKLKHVGYFKDDLEAAQARNKYITENSLICRPSKIPGDL